MALPSSRIPGPVMVEFAGWTETFAPGAQVGEYEKHAVCPVSLTVGAIAKSYVIDIREADYDAAADPVAFVEAAIHATMLQMFVDLSRQITPSQVPA